MQAELHGVLPVHDGEFEPLQKSALRWGNRLKEAVAVCNSLNMVNKHLVVGVDMERTMFKAVEARFLVYSLIYSDICIPHMFKAVENCFLIYPVIYSDICIPHMFKAVDIRFLIYSLIYSGIRILYMFKAVGARFLVYSMIYNNKNSLQAVQLIVFARNSLGLPEPLCYEPTCTHMRQ